MYNIELLANAIVAQAANDYRTSLIRQHEYEERPEGDKYKKWTIRVNDLERFFSGDGVRAFTKLDGVMLMNRLKREVVENKYAAKTLNKYRYMDRGSP